MLKYELPHRPPCGDVAHHLVFQALNCLDVGSCLTRADAVGRCLGPSVGPTRADMRLRSFEFSSGRSRAQPQSVAACPYLETRSTPQAYSTRMIRVRLPDDDRKAKLKASHRTSSHAYARLYPPPQIAGNLWIATRDSPR
jgi:hypothetical protein